MEADNMAERRSMPPPGDQCSFSYCSPGQIVGTSLKKSLLSLSPGVPFFVV